MSILGTHNRVPLIERQTLCLASKPGFTTHAGDESFLTSLGRHYSAPESNANEKLILLKQRLEPLPIDQFWTVLLEGLTDILGTRICFVAKRILPEDSAAVVEMPAHGEPGSCMMAVALYCTDDDKFNQHSRDYKYFSYGGPCAQMKHDKVFLVPSKLLDYARDRANEFQVPVDMYMGMPLVSEGKCFAHFGAMWPTNATEERQLSQGFVEMTLHAIEDLITARLLEGTSLEKAEAAPASPSILEKSAVSIARSLKPLARSLSHELRTPMQGVVGMLDLMYTNVQEALEALPQSHVTEVLRNLKENIEVVQDSSRRAVEAADNVVHAYDLDMQVPGTPDSASVDAGLSPRTTHASRDIPPPRPPKRKRSLSLELKMQQPDLPHQPRGPGSNSESAPEGTERPGSFGGQTRKNSTKAPQTPHGRVFGSDAPLSSPSTPAFRPVAIRDLFRTVMNESLRFGGRPDAAVATATSKGEIIEVRTRTSKGDASTKLVEWSVDSMVPLEMFIDERDFVKLLSALFLNALKFTERGSVKVVARLGRQSRYLFVNVLDTGSGMPLSFQKELFKPFSREDDSLTRQSEGLGLGLLVAKGVARKMGGDITLIRSDVDGPRRGSEFELRVPLSPFESRNRPGTPSRTPTPQPAESSEAPGLPDLDDEKNNSRPLSASDRIAALKSPPLLRAPTNIPPLAAPREERDAGLPNCHVTSAGVNANKARRSPKSPLRFLVAEDNRINRKLLVTMLAKLGYSGVQEAFDGAEAVRLMEANWRMQADDPVGPDVVLMDLWMPNMDGYEATQRILAMEQQRAGSLARRRQPVKILAVTADVTDGALERARAVGMEGLMTKPYKLVDLERLISEHCLS